MANVVTVSNSKAQYYSDIAKEYSEIAKSNADSAKAEVDRLLEDSGFQNVVHDLDMIKNAWNHAINAQSYCSEARAWANKINGVVDDGEYSAKYYALQAKETAENIEASLDTSNFATKEELNLKQNKLVAGDNISIIGNVISSDNMQYELPKATNAVLGGVKVDGITITIDDDGMIHCVNSSQGGSSGGGGTLNYSELLNKPSINNVTLVGNLSLDSLGIQAKGDYALSADIPTKTSDLINNSGFLTSHQDLTDIQSSINSKQDKLIAGDNITIVDGVISATSSSSGGEVDLSAYCTKNEFINKTVYLEMSIDDLSDKVGNISNVLDLINGEDLGGNRG